MALDTGTAADLVEVPSLIIHGEKDEACSPEQALTVYNKIPGPKRIRWLPTDTHIGFYDDETYITPAIAELTNFLDELPKS